MNFIRLSNEKCRNFFRLFFSPSLLHEKSVEINFAARRLANQNENESEINNSLTTFSSSRVSLFVVACCHPLGLRPQLSQAHFRAMIFPFSFRHDSTNRTISSRKKVK